MITVTIPGLTHTNSPLGASPYLTGMPGWYETADVKMTRNQRVGAHGDFDQQPVFDDARYFTIEGAIVATSEALVSLRSTLMALKVIPGQWAVEVEDPSGLRTSMVRLSGQIGFQITDQDGVATFEIPVKAIDPRKYGTEVVQTVGLPTSSGGMTFPVIFPAEFGTPGDSGRIITTNTGEAETVSSIEVTGGLDGFSAVCVELGQELRFERTIPVGSSVLVDLRSGQATIDGQSPVSGFLTRREWWTVPPGATRTIQFNSIGAVSGTPTMTVRTSPAYN